ncbi:MAG: hypothetical protein FJX23_02330 [Alphaproteobacteria bacterium]|nr:hypothetical protein [Alphaproteobacteria bacterium]
MQKKTSLLPLLIIFLITLVVFFLVSEKEIPLPSQSLEFDRIKWITANPQECERKEMLDLAKTIMVPGLKEKQIRDFFGPPTCSKGAVLEYAIGACAPKHPSEHTMLRVTFDDERVVNNKIIIYKATTPSPSADFPTFKRYVAENDPEYKAREWLQNDQWITGAHGEKYGINLDRELVIASPKGEFTFVANFRNGIGGINLASVPSCE